MTVSFSEALAAYRQAAQQAQPGSGTETPINTADGPPQTDDAGRSFGDVLKTQAQDAVQTLQRGETQSLKAAAGTADMQDVVMAMSKAEMTLRSVTSVRDKAIQAYQKIMQMPI